MATMTSSRTSHIERYEVREDKRLRSIRIEREAGDTQATVYERHANGQWSNTTAIFPLDSDVPLSQSPLVIAFLHQEDIYV